MEKFCWELRLVRHGWRSLFLENVKEGGGGREREREKAIEERKCDAKQNGKENKRNI